MAKKNDSNFMQKLAEKALGQEALAKESATKKLSDHMRKLKKKYDAAEKAKAQEAKAQEAQEAKAQEAKAQEAQEAKAQEAKAQELEDYEALIQCHIIRAKKEKPWAGECLYATRHAWKKKHKEEFPIRKFILYLYNSSFTEEVVDPEEYANTFINLHYCAY